MNVLGPVLQAVIARKRYGTSTILVNFQLSVGPGEILVLLGSSGCGKSTALRILAGLDHDFHGDVRLLGRPVTAPSPAVGVLFQEPRLMPWLSVRRNVAFAADGAASAASRVEELLDEVDLRGWGDAMPKALSGGMAQRVALARALFTEPAVLLLDEPFSAVDALTRVRLQDLLLRVVERHRTAVVLVTHDVREAAYLADRVQVLGGEAGRGSFPALLERPRLRGGPEVISLENRLLTALGVADAA
ncbi:MAG: ABC transporter ATP-binding protein [Burkholderiales bacterium]|nr:ABC transporter ATP-binding protein [Burkholderiales bacterium]